LYRNGNHAYVLAYGKDRRNGAPFDSDISAGWPNSFLFADCMINIGMAGNVMIKEERQRQ